MSYNKIPMFTDEINDFIIRKIAAGKMPGEVAQSIYDNYPNLFGEVDGLEPDEVLTIIRQRIYDRKHKETHSSYWRIREEQEEVQSAVEMIDIADPIEQLRILDAMDKEMAKASSDELIDTLKVKIATRLKIITEARRTVELLIPKKEGYDGDLDDIPDVDV